MPILTPDEVAPSPVAYQPRTPATVQLGGLVIEQNMVTDGVTWKLAPLDGWDEPPETSLDATPRTGTHGMRVSQSPKLGGRQIDFAGVLVGHSWNALSAAINMLRSAIPIEEAASLLVHVDGEDALTAQVIQFGRPLFPRGGATVAFSIPLMAPDPRRYSPDVVTASTGLPQTTGGMVVNNARVVNNALSVGDSSSSGLIVVTNDGNMSTPPSITITGPCPPCSLTHRQTGRTLKVPDAIPAGRTLTIDTDNRRAFLDGTAPRTITGAWFEYGEGTNEVAFSAATYTTGALLTSAHRSAWR